MYEIEISVAIPIYLIVSLFVHPSFCLCNRVFVCVLIVFVVILLS